MINSVSNTSLELFPIEPLYCLIYCEGGEIIEVPRESVINGSWGRPAYFEYNEPCDYSRFEAIDVVYISIIEKRAYELAAKFSQCPISKATENEDSMLVIGLGPFGVVALWNYNAQKSSLLGTFRAESVDIPRALLSCNSSTTLKTKCNQYIELHNIKQDVLSTIDKDVALKMMKQYNLKYNIRFCTYAAGMFEDIEYSDLKYIKKICFDGTFDYVADNVLREYQNSGIPQKVFIEWESKQVLYYACMFFEYNLISVLEKFYGAHPETKTDFIISIDPENKKYELALYRQGLKEPVVIPESAYQLIVFKNKFEDYRSENYNQPRGAWIW